MCGKGYYTGKVLHRTKATAEEAAKYLESKGTEYRIRKLKSGYKLDVKKP